MQQKKPKIALVYDRVNTPFGGAEIVLTAIHEIFPEAPIYTSVHDKNKAKWAKKIIIVPSFLQKIPFFKDKHQLLLPFMPLAFESLDLSQYDLIISITSAEAKGILTKPNQKHICYMLTPTRYLYSHEKEYLESKSYLKFPIIKQLAQLIFKYVKEWDKTACYRPDTIIPISNLVSDRIKKFYDIKPEKVLYPPVQIDLSENEISDIPTLENTQKFYLSVSRLVDYKKVDLSVQACIKTQKPLVVVGTGESQKKLHSIAETQACFMQKDETIEAFLQRGTIENKKILFTGKLAQKDVYKLFKNCEALLMPGEEDFGITALEAGIFGKPVIVFYTSGVSELLKDSLHAIHIKKETVPEMVYALSKLDQLKFNAKELRSNALQYRVDLFQKEFKKRIEQELKGQYVIS